MAVVGTNLTSGADTDGNNTVVTSSISPTANALILVGFLTTHNNGSPATPTVSGNGITYALVDSQAFDTDRTLFLFRGQSASPSSGAITITLDRNSLEVDFIVDEFTNVAIGNNGADAIIQSVNEVTTGTTTTLVVDLAAFSSTRNATYGLFGRNGGGLNTGSGFTGLAQPGSSRSAKSQWRNDNDTTVDVTYTSTSILVAGIGVEIKQIENYTRGDESSLPLDDTNLENVYSDQDITDVATSDDTRVAQTATNQYAIHQFKNDIGGASACNVTWEGQTTWPPSSDPVLLQIYNRDTSSWETLDSDNTTAANTDFTLSGNIPDTTDYVDGDGFISCRVYQQATF